MTRFRELLGGLFSCVAALCWLGALATLAWQTWGWLTGSHWPEIALSAPFFYVFGHSPANSNSTFIATLAAMMAQPLSLGFALLGLATQTISKSLD